MDNFLREINVAVFKQWILMQKDNRYKIYIDKYDQDIINIETDDLVGKVTFNPYSIIEMVIYNKILEENDFYLHFEMQTIKHALSLFEEMIDTIFEYMNKPKTKILLCCSGGMTTTFFASKMDEAFKLLGYSVEVNATGYHHLYQEAQDYDIILLAPQVSYYYAEVKGILKTKYVYKIPPQVFGKYDVGKMLMILQDALNSKTKRSLIQDHIPVIKKNNKNRHMILSVSIYKNYKKNYISYNVYDKNQNILSHHDIVKNNLNISDIYDVLNTVFVQYPRIRHIGISLPTIVHDEYLEEVIIDDLPENNLYKALKKKYNKHFYLSNDANNAVMGYYASQDKYQTVAFIFQPIQYPGGSGMVIDGRLHEGYKHLAGEIKYIPMNLSDDYINLTMTPNGTVELVSKISLSLISVINPEVILVKSDLILNVDDVKEELKNYIPEDYIPPIYKIEDLQQYILLGNMVITQQRMEKAIV